MLFVFAGKPEVIEIEYIRSFLYTSDKVHPKWKCVKVLDNFDGIYYTYAQSEKVDEVIRLYMEQFHRSPLRGGNCSIFF